MKSLRSLAELPGELLGARGRFAWLARVSISQALALEVAVLFLVGCIYAGVRYIPRLRYSDMLERTYGDASAMVSPDLVSMRKDTAELDRRAGEIRRLVVPGEAVGDIMERLSSLCSESGIRFGSLRRSGRPAGDRLSQVTLVLSAEGDFAGLVRFLRNVESHVPLASVRQVQVFAGDAPEEPLAARFVFGVVVGGLGKETG